MEMYLNDYGLEMDTYIGSLYLPWHTIIVATALIIAYKIYKVRRDKWQQSYVLWWDLVQRICQLTNSVSP